VIDVMVLGKHIASLLFSDCGGPGHPGPRHRELSHARRQGQRTPSGMGGLDDQPFLRSWTSLITASATVLGQGR
jgi:hypothetical protein